MRAAIFDGHTLTVQNVSKSKPVRDQVMIRIQYAALNHRDIWLMEEPPPGIHCILGSDACGVVEEVGDDVDPLFIGMEVIVLPSLNWGENPLVQGNDFKILGHPDNGTLADFLVISKKYIVEKPEHLTKAQCAAVPLAGLTAYRALFSKARLRSKEKVLITGIGGGAALFALQFAVHYQARVYVTSSSPEKIQKAKDLGAINGYNYQESDWSHQLLKEAGEFDIIIDSAGGPQFSHFIDLCAPGGRIVNFGRTNGNIGQIETRKLYYKQLAIFGTTMGTRDEFLSMLDFVEGRKIEPVIDSTFPLEEIHHAFERMKDKMHFGKIVIQVNH